jgi:hypothetical protein
MVGAGGYRPGGQREIAKICPETVAGYIFVPRSPKYKHASNITLDKSYSFLIRANGRESMVIYSKLGDELVESLI